MYSIQQLLDTGYFVYNDYFNEYVTLINNNRDTEYVACETNKHHVLPRHYFTSRNIRVDNSSDNIVNLSYKDHALAHLLLSGCTQGRDKYKNLYSVFYMSGQRYFEKIEDYQELLESYPDIYMSAISAAPNHRKGTKCSEETKKKMSEAQKGIVRNINYIWVNNGSEETMIPPEDLTEYQTKGFTLGRAYRHARDVKDKIRKSQLGVKRSPEFCEKMRQIALNQPAHTEEQNHKHSEYLKEYYQSHDNPFAGKQHSEESKKKMSEALKHKVTINNGIKTIRVMDYNLERYLNNGWVLGKRT